MSNEHDIYHPELQFVVIETNENSKNTDRIKELIDEYEILNDKCERALKRIYERRGGN